MDQEAVLDNVLYARAYTSKHSLFSGTNSHLQYVQIKRTALLKIIGEHQSEMLDYVAAKFHEEMGVFKLLVSWKTLQCIAIAI